MPTDINLSKEGMIYQRDQYKKEGISKKYWLFKDEQLIKLTAGANDIVDIGCGEGILLEKLVKRLPNKNVFGIDAEEENIGICRKHNLPVKFGSVYDLPLDDRSIDCILFTEVIEHLDRPDLALKEMHRVLKKEGKIIVLFPNDFMFLVTRLMMLRKKEAFYNTGHVKQWTPNKIRPFIKKYGFKAEIQKNLPFILWPISLHHLVVGRKEK